MELGTVNPAPVGARFGACPPDDLAGLFAPVPLEDAEAEGFGTLDARLGWVGAAGPGVALRTTLGAPFDPAVHTVELRVRSNGRYIRSRVRTLADAHGDVLLAVEAAPVVYAFLPYAALPPAVREITVEVWLVEDGDPIEEALYPLTLPGHEARRLDNALTAVVLALVSAIAAPVEVGVTASGVLEGAVAALFELDAVGRAWASEIVADAEPEPESSIAAHLQAHVAPAALGQVLALLGRFARTARAIAYLGRLTALLGVSPGRTPRPPRAGTEHFVALGLAPGATRDEVRAAYRKAAAAIHPDLVPEAERLAATEKMKGLNAAYAALRRK